MNTKIVVHILLPYDLQYRGTKTGDATKCLKDTSKYPG